MLFHLPNVLRDAQLQIVRAAMNQDQAPWVDGKLTAGHQGVTVKNNQQLDPSSQMARDLGHLVVTELERNELFIGAVLPHRLYPPMFNRYGVGMQFGTHVDGAIRRLPGTGQQLRTDLSATVFLSPPDSYDGGELIIENDFGSQSIKLPAGDMIVYAATSRHRVSAVTRGMRAASVFWVQSLIRDHAQRSQLFELDRAIQRLTQTGADADSLVRLAGHYHGLLRLWSEN